MDLQVDVFDTTQAPLVLTYGKAFFETCGEACLGLAMAVPGTGAAQVTHTWTDPENNVQTDVQSISLSGAQPAFMTKFPIWMKADPAETLTILVEVIGGTGSVKVSRCVDF